MTVAFPVSSSIAVSYTQHRNQFFRKLHFPGYEKIPKIENVIFSAVDITLSALVNAFTHCLISSL